MVFENKFAYSHHASDPAYGQEFSAFDLVRIHLFEGDYKQMAEMATNDDEVKLNAVSEKRGEAESDFVDEDWEKKLTFDKLVVNLDSYELIVDGVKVDTPPKEMELLYHLAASPNRVFTRNQLLDEVWGFDYFGDSRTVDVHVKRLREKLEGVSDKWCLKTVWGVGYKFEVTE